MTEVTTPHLRIERFCGHQRHPVRAVEIYVARPDVIGQPVLLNVECRCDKAVEETTPEGEQLGWTRPSVEVWIPLPDLELATLDDRRVHIPWAYLEERDALNRLYVCEHETWWGIDVHLEVMGGRVHLVCDGVARDPNHYDGSTPDAAVHLEVVFDLT